MTTKLVCYGGRTTYESNRLNRTEAFTLSVVEHVLGSNQFVVNESDGDFTELLIQHLDEENFLISENLFTRLVQKGAVKPSAVFCNDELHKTINVCKEHTSNEWQILDSEQ
ncbi:hypothetical protein ACF8FL_00050 [Vibrio sp. zbq_19]|uniref:hypothetical protein n=1 Tax=unclassified Vibrio TaxID=2614977 RepID=UPI0006D035EA|nr:MULTISPECIES: hypothetical protein [unclassified Vibrio]MCG9679146.1 hypothetical protein [Vibrio sp. Isolate24]MDW1833089.1 hypothetical protein [Vibrio sp. Vb1755]